MSKWIEFARAGERISWRQLRGPVVVVLFLLGMQSRALVLSKAPLSLSFLLADPMLAMHLDCYPPSCQTIRKTGASTASPWYVQSQTTLECDLDRFGVFSSSDDAGNDRRGCLMERDEAVVTDRGYPWVRLPAAASDPFRWPWRGYITGRP